MVKNQRKLTLLLLLACLCPAACGNAPKESEPPSGAPLGAAAYTAAWTPFPGQTDSFFYSCVSGGGVYVADSLGRSILRFPLEGGEAQALPAYAPAEAGEQPAATFLSSLRAGEDGGRGGGGAVPLLRPGAGQEAGGLLCL